MSLPDVFDPLPSSFTWGKVVGRIIHAIADTDEDTDDKPQARAAVGKVHFTPKDTVQKTPSGSDYHAIVMQGRETATLSASGRILDAEGRQGIWLVSGVWTVSFEVEGGKVPAFDIEVNDTYTDLAPLDLATVAPYTPPTGAVTQTMVVPAGASDGQVLTWDAAEGALAWEDAATGGGTELTSYVTQVETLADYPSTFPPDKSGLTKGDVGLGNVDNTPDADKPVSTATQTALDGKAGSSDPTLHFLGYGSTPPDPTGLPDGQVWFLTP